MDAIGPEVNKQTLAGEEGRWRYQPLEVMVTRASELMAFKNVYMEIGDKCASWWNN
jgi:hypothetical protein